MATIARYVADMEVDPSGVKRGMDRAAGYIREFSKTADQELAASFRSTAGFEQKAIEAAENLVKGLQEGLQRNSGILREQLARGVISPAQFATMGKNAAAAYNAALLGGMQKLRAGGLVTAESLTLLQEGLDGSALGLDKITRAASHSTGGLSLIRREVTTMGRQMLGILPVFGQLSGALGQFAFGAGPTIAVVAGIVAIVYAWQQATAAAREAKAAMEEFAKSDDAFRARSAAESTVQASLSGVRGGFGSMIHVEGVTKEIDEAQKAVQGFQNELAKTSNVFTGSTRAPVVQMEALRHEFLAGKIDAAGLNVELAKFAVAHPEYAVLIGQTAKLAAGLDAARASLERLVAVEQHAAAIKTDLATRFGVTPELTRDLRDAQARLAALTSGGEPALKAIEREQSATEAATKAWDAYVVTNAGAKFATLAFADALKVHNPVAEQAYRDGLALAEANDKVADGLKAKNPVELIEHTTTALLAWHEAAVKTGRLTSVFSPRIADAIIELEKVLASQTDKLSDDAIKLTEALDKMVNAFALVGGLPKAGSIPLGAIFPGAVATPLLRGGTEAHGIQLAGPSGGPGFNLPAPTAAAKPDQISFQNARLNAALSELASGAHSAASSLFDVVKSGFSSLVRNVVSQLSPFALITKSLADAMAPLTPVLQQIAQVVGDTLGPIFEALAPIIQSFIPFFRALLQIIAPLVRALLPILEAFVPILEALFPIIKFTAIAFTYVVQAAADVASILLRMAGNVVTVFGIILKGLATAIDHLPFVSAKGAINAAQDLIDFGHGLLTAADDFKKTADAMGDARKEINAVNIDHTAVAVDALGDAANKTTEALTNAPAWFKIAGARFGAADAVARHITPPPPHPVEHRDYPQVRPADTGGSTGGGSAGGNGGVVITGDVYVDARTASKGELFDMILDEGQKRARAQLGDASKWAEVQQ